MDGEALKIKLKQLGWSQRKLASRLGVTVDTVNKWAINKVPVPNYVEEYIRVVSLAKEILEEK